jgi:hypothetical protein
MDTKEKIFEEDTYPLYDWTLHPAVFAWRVVIAKVSNETQLSIPGSKTVQIPLEAVYPMTAMSRLIYLLENNTTYNRDVVNWTRAVGLSNSRHWFVLRSLVIVVLILGVLSCIRLEYRGKG